MSTPTDTESPAGITEKTAYQVMGAAHAVGMLVAWNEDRGELSLSHAGKDTPFAFTLTTESQARAWLAGVSIACRGRL